MQEALGAGPSEEQESAFKEPALVEPKKGKGKVPGTVGERGHGEWTKIEEEGVLEERLETEWIELYIVKILHRFHIYTSHMIYIYI